MTKAKTWLFSGLLTLATLTMTTTGCVSPRQGSDATATATTVAQAADEIAATVRAGFDEIMRRRTESVARGTMTDAEYAAAVKAAVEANMTVGEWTFIALQVAAVATKYVPSS